MGFCLKIGYAPIDSLDFRVDRFQFRGTLSGETQFISCLILVCPHGSSRNLRFWWLVSSVPIFDVQFLPSDGRWRWCPKFELGRFTTPETWKRYSRGSCKPKDSELFLYRTGPMIGFAPGISKIRTSRITTIIHHPPWLPGSNEVKASRPPQSPSHPFPHPWRPPMPRKTMAQSKFPIAPEKLIQRAKEVLASEFGTAPWQG